MAVADDALVSVVGLEIGMLAKKIRDLRLDGLGEQGLGTTAKDIGELILECSWQTPK